MPEQRADIDRNTCAFNGVEIFGKGLEWPVAQTGGQGICTHALDLLQRGDHQLAVFGPGRCDTKTTISGDHAGHAVPRRDGEHRVPHHLGVVMGVDVDEARRDDAVLGIDGRPRASRCLANGDDGAVTNAEIARSGGRARAVDDHAPGDLDVVVHCPPSGLDQARRKPNPASSVAGMAAAINDGAPKAGHDKKPRLQTGPGRSAGARD